MRKIIFIILFMLFASTVAANHPQKYKRISETRISQSASLKLKPFFSKRLTGKYLQKINIETSGRTLAVYAHLSLDHNKLEVTVFNDISGRLAHVQWFPDHIQWENFHRKFEKLPPENMIADFLLAQLPLDLIQKSLRGGSVYESKNLRIIKDKTGLIRTISRQRYVKGLWHEVTIENPKLNYKLTIQTVGLG